MNTHTVRTGTLTILLLVTTIVIAVLSVLALQISNVDRTRTELYLENTTAYYANDAAAQQMLALLDAACARPHKKLTVSRLQKILGAGCKVENAYVSTIVVDGQCCDPDSITTTDANFETTGLSTSGTSQGYSSSKPALSVLVSYNKDGYKIKEWSQQRAYDEKASNDEEIGQ